MADLGDDETFALFVSTLAALGAVIRWYALLARGRRTRPTLLIAPAACAAILIVALRSAAAREVASDWRYLLLFESLGLACALGVASIGSLLGVSLRHDAIERGNRAATVAICGAMLGETIAYAGANVGEGATIWTTIGPAALATAGLLIAWIAIESVGHASEAITIDRDLAGGIRLGGALVAIGAILGRSVAGDYLSVDATLHDFARLGWPAMAIAIVAGILDHVVRPTPRVPHPPMVRRGVVPAIVYLAIAAVGSSR